MKQLTNTKMVNNEMGGKCSTYGERRGEERSTKEFSGTLEGKGALGRLKRRWEENIK
jgi:hypothetical protein